MNPPIQTAGGAWRTIREAFYALVASPLGCLAVGLAFLGTGGIIHQSVESDKKEAARAVWAAPGPQDLRDSLRDESAVRDVRVAPSRKKPASDAVRAKALRAEVGAALAAALADTRPR